MVVVHERREGLAEEVKYKACMRTEVECVLKHKQTFSTVVESVYKALCTRTRGNSGGRVSYRVEMTEGRM